MGLKVPAVTVIDFETTGLDVNKAHRIVEIGALKWRDHELIGVYDALINPERDIPAEVTRVHGITDGMVAHAAAVATVAPELISFIGDDLVVMHNVSFDSGFLERALDEAGIPHAFAYYDTLRAARKRYPTAPNYRLSTLKNLLNLAPFGIMHRALSDAFVTLQLYLKLENLWAVDTKNRLERQLEELLRKRPPEARFFVRER